MVTQKVVGPINTGKEWRVLDETLTAAGTREVTFSLDAESVIVSLYVTSISGDVDLEVFTEGDKGERLSVLTFPTLSAPSTELVIQKAAATLRKVVIVVTATDACAYNVRVRGASSEQANISISGAGSFRASQKDQGTTAAVLIASALSARDGILVFNNNVGTNDILYLGGTLAEAVSTNGGPIYPGGNISVNLAPGAVLYAVAGSGTIDVRIVETGGA